VVVPAGTSTEAAWSQAGKSVGKPQAAGTSSMIGLANVCAGPQKVSTRVASFEKRAAQCGSATCLAKVTDAATSWEFGASTRPPAMNVPSFTPMLPAPIEKPLVRSDSRAKSTYVLRSRLGSCAGATPGERTAMVIAVRHALRMANIGSPSFVATTAGALLAPLERSTPEGASPRVVDIPQCMAVAWIMLTQPTRLHFYRRKNTYVVVRRRSA
jgi:hypothetical protein